MCLRQNLAMIGCALAVSLASFMGCNTGPVEIPKAPVSGNVTLDGNPLPDGQIVFESPAQAVNDALPITNGKFSGQVSIGEHKVKISAFREAKSEGAEGYVPPDQTTSKENFLPAKYHNESTMTAKVEKGQENSFNFEVTSN